MSILIKDMEMPESCDDCEFIQRGYPDWCDLSCRSRDLFNSSIRPDWCPLEEAEPVRHGRWEETEYSAYDDSYRCSACGEVWEFIEGTPKDNGANYCPNCGARMIDEVEDDN